ncbi:MAG: methylated-DNA--[protein]-cysteine S-methyltransferase [Chitinispirillales bacterium]|jgi:methylated-DNA-[protein]-cysteine S-methyltransferase|nr:methylated-DNA--[protein]-cysteine S-methyltransferase [Chitinispirillales bacterium]
MEYIQKIKSPIGTLTVSSDGTNVTGLWIEGQKYFARTLEKGVLEKNVPIFESVRDWLGVYFSGKRPNFTPPLVPKGNLFQKSIWDILCKIPYGQTTTYGAIADEYGQANNGKPTSARAVGGAVGHNPISILIPCHRVVGKNNDLTGYAGGLHRKKVLLKLEGVEYNV